MILRSRAASLLAIATLLASVLFVPRVAHAATADDFAALRDRWEVSLTGGSSYDPTDPDIAARIASITSDAQTLWDTMDKSADRTYLWSDDANVANDSAQKTSTYTNLAALALAYRTHGSTLEGSATLRDDIVGALQWLYDHAYNENTPTNGDWTIPTGNWWDMMIGVPEELVDILDLMRADLTSDQMQLFLRPVLKFPSFTSMTGANLVWIANVWARSAALLDDDARLSHARDELSSVFLYVTTSDGFYADGSFVQHEVAPYTGGYGAALLADLSDLMVWLDGSPWQITDPNSANVIRWVYDGFEPLMYRGAMMDMTRGRNVSRSYTTDQDAGEQVISAVMRVAGFAPAADALHFRGLVKGWILDDTYQDFFASASLPDILTAKAILTDDSIPAVRTENLYKQYGSMDRAVQWRPDYTFALSMSSDRIGAPEMSNGENQHGWYQSEGMTYLYNADTAQYSDDYWPTVDPYHLPGTTIDVHPVANGVGSGYRSALREAGGAEILGQYGTSSMKVAALNSTMQAKKSWFAFDDEVVALGAGIVSNNGDDIQTTVDNRKLSGAGDQTLTVNGATEPSNLGWSDRLTDVKTVHLDGNVPGTDLGYYFPQGATVNAQRDARTGAWSDIDTRATADTTPITADYLTMYLDHGVNPTNATYEYALLPGKSAAQVDAYGEHPDFTVLANTPTVQAVRENTLGVTGYQFWGAATEDGVTSDARAAVMTAPTDDGLDVSVSDPSQHNTGTIDLEIDQSATMVVALDPGVTVTQLSPTIKLQVATDGAEGKTFHAQFSSAPVTAAPGTPVLRPASSVDGALRLSWDPASQAQGYVVKYGTAPGDYTHTVDVGAATTYAVTDPDWGQTYYYTVSAYNDLGTSPDARPGSAKPLYFHVVDNDDPSAVTIVGDWAVGASGGFYGVDYLHDRDAGQGTKSVTYHPDLPPGLYRVSLWWASNANRSTVVPVTVHGSAGDTTLTVNQRNNGSKWNSIGTYVFAGDGSDSVQISNTGTTDGYVIADAVEFEQLVDTTPPTTTATASGTLGDDGWYTSSVTVSLTASDDLAGVGATYYAVDGGPQRTGTSVQLSTDGTHVVAFHSVDRLGNAEASQQLTVKIDTAAPTFVYDANGGAGTVPDPRAGLQWTDSGLDAPGTGLTRTGYAFAGWNTAPDGSGTAVTPTTTAYAAGVRGQDTVTLYAQWTLTAPTWQASQVYTAGDLVSFSGRIYQAQWWTQNETPGASPWSAWAEVGDNLACGGGIVSQWTPSMVYDSGDTVTLDGQRWTAQWWTRDQRPGADASGPWVRAGTC